MATMLMEQYARASFDSYQDFVENFSISVPRNYNFAYDCVDVLAATRPDDLAILWCNDKGAEARYTFSQVAQKSDEAARFFASLGIGKGDAVMLILKRRVQYWFCVLGLMKLGAVAVPATHLLTVKDIVYRNNAADIAAIVAVDDEPVLAAVEGAMTASGTVRRLIKLGAARKGWHSLDEALAAGVPGEKPARTTRNGDMMMLYFTSGTTGLPKMVAHDYTYPLGHIITARFWQNLHPGSIHLTVADTGWAKACWGKLFGQWLCGAAVFVYDHERFNAHEMLTVISRHHVTSFCAPPTVFRHLIKQNLAEYDLSALEYVTTAGEPLNAEVFRQFKKQTGIDIYEAYGQTETTPLVITPPSLTPRPGSLGKASPAYDLVLLDENGSEVAPGQEGEICVRNPAAGTPGMFMGYHRDDLLTASAWRGGVYHTGDRAWQDEEGYLWFIGRADDVIKSSGYRIGPFEVESVMLEHPAVLECAVTGVPDPIRGAAVKATVVLAPGFEPCETLKAELQAHVKATTAPYKYPRVVEFVSELPKTISGKIRHVSIRQQDQLAAPKPKTVPTPAAIPV